jgi:hypothetical protein
VGETLELSLSTNNMVHRWIGRIAPGQSPPVANLQSTLTTKSLEDLTILDIKTILNENKIPFDHGYEAGHAEVWSERPQ